MLTVEQRIQRGIAYLDLFAPANWRDTIQKRYINMANVYDCVAGQVFGSYHNLPYRFSRADYGFTQNDMEELDYGRQLDEWYETDNHDEQPIWGKALRDEWVKQLSV